MKKNTEIERKFLVRECDLPNVERRIYSEIVQGYVQSFGSSYHYRLRQALHFTPTNGFVGEQYFQTIKSTETKVRGEYEVELFKNQFMPLWPLCKNISVTKKRYKLNDVYPMVEGEGIEDVALDIYKADLKGLHVIEVEFDTEKNCDAFQPPSWFGVELTEDVRYNNFYLALDGLPDNFKDIK